MLCLQVKNRQYGSGRDTYILCCHMSLSYVRMTSTVPFHEGLTAKKGFQKWIVT